ncbi:MAG TPA: tRNA 2-thiouridine(34) synthase MnmA [Bacteroidales bacterium]|nr:tRNA 2-thiouridine(34) synthase MnmA [Bacteroidales bacterium]
MKRRVVIGLSGGVDSSIAAWKLKQDGFDVVALFMKNWHDTTGVLKGDCPYDDDIMFAELVARRLKIPFYQVDLSIPYKMRVIDYMFSEYEKGRTPNPDVLCNREIKFDSFVEEANKFGADYIATGHYCRRDQITGNGTDIYRLLAGADKNKDQSYFLCQITQDQLSRVIFPIGDFKKPEVRRIAEDLNLATAQRKDSQGICFVGKVDLPTFLQQQLKTRTGRTVEISTDWHYPAIISGLPGNDIGDQELENICRPYDYNPSSGKTIGKHEGAYFFTVGQRKGINIGGYNEPLFVIGLDVEKNILYVGEGQSHPGLHRKGLFIKEDEIHWVRPDLMLSENESRDYKVRIRYRQSLETARLFRRREGIYIVFKKPQRGIAPGQFAAWYDDQELIGSGVIHR